MGAFKILFCLLVTHHLALARFSTREFLECRTNLSEAVKNDTVFLSEVRRSQVIFTGKVREVSKHFLTVQVKRAIKGVLRDTVDLAVNHSCDVHVRRGYTGIFLGLRGDRHEIYMHFGPVTLTLVNLDRLHSAIKGILEFSKMCRDSNPCLRLKVCFMLPLKVF